MTRRNKGFTLVELVIVIAILAIIMLIAIPNLSGVQQRMQVRADKASATQICKAVRIWYTDKYATQNQYEIPELVDSEDESVKIIPYAKLDGIEEHIAGDLVANSLLNNGTNGGQYYVTVIYTGISLKFLIGIDKEPTAKGTAPTLTIPTSDPVTDADITYNGEGPGWVYLEK